MQQRYYDPVALRFLSPDPVDVSASDGGNFNRYWYANSNPYRYVDPDGRSPINAVGGVVGFVGGAVAGGLVAWAAGGGPREVAASAAGGAVGGALIGVTLGAGTQQGVMIATGITAGILGETTAQTAANAFEHGTDVSSYSYRAAPVLVSGLLGTGSALSGGLTRELGRNVLHKWEEQLVADGIMFVPNLSLQRASLNSESQLREMKGQEIREDKRSEVRLEED